MSIHLIITNKLCVFLLKAGNERKPGDRVIVCLVFDENEQRAESI